MATSHFIWGRLAVFPRMNCRKEQPLAISHPSSVKLVPAISTFLNYSPIKWYRTIFCLQLVAWHTLELSVPQLSWYGGRMWWLRFICISIRSLTALYCLISKKLRWICFRWPSPEVKEEARMRFITLFPLLADRMANETSVFKQGFTSLKTI